MLRPHRFVFIFFVFFVCFVACTHAAPPAAVDKSIVAATAWLYSQQTDGNWEEVPTVDPKAKNRDPKGGQFTGRTALAVLALLNAGESSQDERIKKAVDFLLKTPTKGVYALGLRCQMWAMLPPTPVNREALRVDATFLMGSVKSTGNGRGMYDYTPAPAGKSYSHSRSQYAVLGMWAAEQANLEVPDTFWKLVEDAWKKNQDKSGGWTYMNPAETKYQCTPGMTTVGVATLFITQECLREGTLCRGNLGNEAIENGIKWIGQNMAQFATDQPYARDFPFPTLYAYERVGAASGLRYFNGVDWYEKGTDWLITKQNPDGSWASPAANAVPQVADTCFAMLFLAKGRAPIVISKLQYFGAGGKAGNWNQRSRDISNVTRWIGRTIERDLAFQVIDTNATLADMIEAPILYIAGNEAPVFTDSDKAKIKAYVEGGGIVVANADCGGPEFCTAFKALGKELFPISEFGELPEDDLIYTGYYPRAKWKSKPTMQTLGNGARLQMVLIPQADPAKAWQLQDSKSKLELFELAADLHLYSVDQQNLRYRGDRFYLPDDPAAKPTKTVAVARLKYPGYWDPEPGGWRRLNNFLIKQQATNVTVTTAELGKNQIGAAKFAHLTGTYEYKFTDAQCDELKKFVTAGGTLIIDAAGGSSPFATSVESLIARMFPANKLTILPPEHPLFFAGGADPDAISYRTYAIKNGVGKIAVPRLQGITLNKRLAVVYSREDLSVGLVGQSVGGIVGYSPVTATNLMARILIFDGDTTATRPSSRPATGPATIPATGTPPIPATGAPPTPPIAPPAVPAPAPAVDPATKPAPKPVEMPF